MPITFLQNQDIFTVDADILINPVNTVGVMGKGLAKQFKLRFPEECVNYFLWCGRGEFEIGDVLTVTGGDKVICHFPTKKGWCDPSKMEYIEKSLDAFKVDLQRITTCAYIPSVAFPKIGCGCGGLDWRDVKLLLINKLNVVPNQIYILE